MTMDDDKFPVDPRDPPYQPALVGYDDDKIDITVVRTITSETATSG
jgi:hypothetical protein